MIVLVLASALLVGLLGPLWRPRCPSCRWPGARVIQHGLPVWFCFKHDEPLCFGVASYALLWLPFDGHLLEVSGPYLLGLWRWLTHHHEE